MQAFVSYISHNEASKSIFMGMRCESCIAFFFLGGGSIKFGSVNNNIIYVKVTSISTVRGPNWILLNVV